MMNDVSFRQQVLAYYRRCGRHDLPWRRPEADGWFDPYKILVSEIMLQQTQVSRVVPKFINFTKQFPDALTLAEAPLGDVLRAWSGLGYNRRAKFLRQAAHMITSGPGAIPEDLASLIALPGVGSNTAGAIRVYAFNKPAVFVETNIRTAVIHHYFADQTAIGDQAILEIVARSLPRSDVRGWYWALMDYGSSLKQSVGNLNAASRSYTKQSRFAGSRRQVRGQVIHLLGERPRTAAELQALVRDEQLPGVLGELELEQLIRRSDDLFSL